MQVGKLCRRAVRVGLILIMQVSATVSGGLATGVRADVVDSMEKALMPGPLHEAHMKFEEECTKCHAFFKQSRQNDLCLNCHDHKNVADDIKNKRGFHGMTPDIREKDCKDCHREHLGRKAEIIFLDQQTFNHNATDFKLQGAHKSVQCKNCHKPDKRYSEAKGVCFDCHEKAEPHKGTLGKVCDSCHRETAWNDFQFDHSRTDFKLEGKHRGVECRDCHPQERYLEIPTDCYSCHKLDDKHKGSFGTKCNECHAPTGWASQAFDHDKDTDFKLTGQHRRLTCNQCHKDDAFKVELKTDCYSCHKLTDEHKGAFGKKCHECHTTTEWAKPTFDHDKTDFALRGKHKETACTDCHSGDLYKEKEKDKVKKDCYGCHKQHDAHNGQQGKQCNDCHDEKGWKKNVAFDHDITQFPLLGSHASLACEECHSSTNFKDVKVQCGVCHTKDDVHKRRLGRMCGRCHISSDWKAWRFDHDKDTDFKLKGSHKGKDCHACHREPVEDEIELPKKCFGCHAGDDAHDGGFGRVCERCHNEKSFEEVNIK